MTDALERSVYVSWFSTAREARPDYEIAVSWLGFAALMTNPHKRRITADERTVPLISFARFEGGRTNDHVTAMTALVLKFDGSTKYEAIRQFAAEYEFIAYSTHAHTAEKPKFQVIFLPSREITLAEWPRVQAIANAMFGNKADRTARDPAHLFPVPSAPAKKKEAAFAHYNHGKLLDPNLLLSSNAMTASLGSLPSADFVSIASHGRGATRPASPQRVYPSSKASAVRK